MPQIPKTNTEARLLKAAPCGVIRDSHEMTMVRLSDVRDALDSIAHYRERANALDAEKEALTAAGAESLKDVKRLKRSIAESIITLQNAASDSY